uniref:ATP-dependent Clp protease proteolytic subunit n=1 Tax=Blidingia minima TaxID=63414 RepID=A0A2Z4M9H7_9CHLO|nr:clp protease proteolytic subunit [Blidingia minima]AWX53128.1 ClpP [Blidingia minima]QPF96243.1 clp protease proteolytic subunit [Blidingia minima]QUX32812.1 ATP-dependent Clp protease proteolytic subunit [Blidingia minima]
MPVGVPKVPYRFSDDTYAEWVDLYNRLYRERLLFLCQDLNAELANQLIGLMVYLNAEDETLGLFMYINSPGGSVTCGIGVSDVMSIVEADVTTICVGTAASMASFVLASGSQGLRIALPNTRVMLHQSGGGSRGQTSSVLSEAREMLRMNEEVVSVYSQKTGQTPNQIRKDMKRDQYLSAREAKSYGLVDQVAASI